MSAGAGRTATPAALRISVVIPTYNSREYIPRAIRSVLEQTCPPLEIIVVDDGSTDGTGELIAREFGDRVHYHYQENRGPSAARNRGVSLASGDWIAFLDADNYWTPDKLELQAAEALAHPEVALVACRSQIVGAPDRGRWQFPKPLTREVIRERVKLRNVWPMAVLVRRDVLQALGGFDESLFCGEDREMWARIVASYDVAVVDRPLLMITVLPTGLCSNPRLLQRDGLVVNRKVMSVVGNRSWPGRWKDRLTLTRADAQVFLSVARAHSSRQETGEAARAVTRALLTWPFWPLGVYSFAVRQWIQALPGKGAPEQR